MSASCPTHPGVAADYTCSRCRQPCCMNCCYSMPDGSICCANCYSQSPTASSAAPSVSPAATTPTSTAARGCPQHPLLPPVAFCKVCGKGSCVTCDFYFPPNLHLCPVCVMTTQSALTPMRKKYMVTGFVMASMASIGAVLALSGVLAGLAGDSLMAAFITGLAIIVVVTIPTTVGTGVAWAALRKGGPNPIGVWIALVWNVLLLGVIVFIMVMNSLIR